MINIRQIKTASDFNTFKDMQGDEVHVVKMSAEWCGPCRMLENVILNLDTEKVGTTLFAEVDVDDEEMEQITYDYNIRGIPVLLYFKNGEVAKRSVGLVTADDIYKVLNELK